MTVLVGQTTSGVNPDFFGTGHTAAWRFAAAATGTISQISAQFKVANATLSSCSLGIYADGAGGTIPGNKLESQTVASGYTGTGLFTATGFTTAVTSGTFYWLAVAASGEQVDFQGTTDTLGQEQNSVMPAPWGAAFGGMGSIPVIYAEDAGVVVMVSPLSTPARIAPIKLALHKPKIFGWPVPIPPVIVTFQSINIAPALETDAAVALTKFKSKTLGVALETDLAVALSKAKHVTLTFGSETDTAVALIKLKTKTLGVASETDTAQALKAVKQKILGVATETDTAIALSITHGAPQFISILAATETDTAVTLVKQKSVTVVSATETDSARPLAKVKQKLLGVSTELDSAQGLTKFKSKTLSFAGETDSAVSLVKYKTKTLGVAGETDTARPLVFTKTIFKTLTPAAELDFAVHLTFTGGTPVVTQGVIQPIIIGRF